MFDKKPLPSFNFDKLGPDFLRYLERVEELEDDDSRLARAGRIKSLSWDTSVSEARRNLRHIKGELASMKAEVHELKEMFIHVVEDFKTRGSDEDLAKIRNRIDAWRAEELISKQEFKKLLLDSGF